MTKPETIYFLGFNFSKKILRDIKLREAILLSLDRKKIVNTLNRTNAEVGNGPIPVGILNSIDLLKQKSYNLEEAKNLIKKSGYNGSKLILVGFEDSPRTRIFFDIVVNYLNQIGIEIEKMYYNKWEEFLKAREFDDFDLTLEGWGADILGDPYFFLHDLFYSNSNFNVFHYKNEKVDKLLNEAVRTFDMDKRYKMYEEINNIIIDDIPAVFISQIKDVFVVNKRIKNVIINPYRYIEYDKVIIN
jgi:ABC-type transport system substrate-binding protein